MTIPFWNWFTNQTVIGGDWRFFWPQNLKEILSYSYAWDQSLNNGMGQSNIIILWLNSYLSYSTHFLNQMLLIPWGVAEKIIFFWPIIFISFLSAFFLSRKYIPSLSLNVIAGILYLTNTYALMIFSGGQVGIGLAYSLIPFLLLVSIFLFESLEKKSKILLIRNSLIVALAFSIEMLLEPRITLISLVVISLYFILYFLIIGRIKIKRLISSCLVIGIVVALVHSFWILPLFFVKESLSFHSLEKAANFQFLSFANFSDSLSLLHPNWPDNIFGKTYFMRPEFLILPIIIFSSLFFLRNPKSETNSKFKIQSNLTIEQFNNSTIILFFSFLGLLGAFLAKGTNPPFGQVYIWLFDYVPGFVAFRDPTKWYMLIALSYSILLSISLYEIRKVVISYINKRLGQGILVFFLIFWIFSIRQAFIPGLPGTFKDRKIPQEYSGLAKFLEDQPSYFRTLWIPQVQRFGYFSNSHPAISAQLFLKVHSLETILNNIKQPSSEKYFQEASIKYIIVPYDSEGEIFLNDRKYSENSYLQTLDGIKSVPWLTYKKNIGKIALFEVDKYKDHIWTMRPSDIFWERINSTRYAVIMKKNSGGKLIFAESYNSGWQASFDGKKFKSTEYNGMNAFQLEGLGSNFIIEFEAQRWVEVGHLISISILIIVLIGIFLVGKRHHKYQIIFRK